METIAATEARANFAELLRRVSVGGGPIVIERRGKPCVAMVPVEDLERRPRDTGDRTPEDSDWLREVLENSPVGVAIVSHNDDGTRLTGDRLFVNSAVAEMFGATSRESFIEAGIENSWVDKEQLKSVEEIFKSRRELVNFEAQRRRMDGSLWWVSLYTRPIRFDGQDCTMVWHFDITERKRAEEGLRQKTAQLQSILDHSPAMIFLKDAEGRYLLVNREFERVFETTNEAAAGKRPDDILPPGLAESSRAEDLKVLGTARPSTSEDTFGVAGRERTILASKFPVLGEADQVIGIGTVANDITERKGMEESLKESEERFRAFIENSPAAILIKDIEGRYLIANKRWHDWFNPGGREIAGTTVSDFYAERHAREITDSDRAVLSTGAAVELELDTPFADGTSRATLLQKFPILDSEGAITAIGGINTDVSELKRAETLLARAMEVSPAVFALFDPDDRLVICNRKYRQMYETPAAPMVPGVAFEALVRGFAAEVGIGRSDEETEAWVAKRLERRAAPARSYAYQRGDGEWIEVSDHLLEDGSIFTVGMIVTERKRIEADLRQAQKMEAVGQLTGGLAHDFNNLLAVIQGNAELLANGVGQESRLIQAILRASERGAELTHRLLAFSRQQSLLPRPIDLPELVQGMTDMLKRTLGETIEVETLVEDGLAAVMADPGQLENALLNLAINARDAMPEGGKLTIEFQDAHLDEAYAARNPEATEGDYMVLAVSDTGTGMSAEVRAHAFEPFFTTKEVGKGSGLGLSMVHGFAKQSGGHVTIYSETNQGTTVKMYLPRAEGPARSEAKPPPEEIPRGQGETVLVVEDDADVRALAIRMLEDLGYRTLSAPDAAGAKARLLEGAAPDLILSDVVLPGGISGPEFAEAAGKTHSDLKVVFMSGYPAEAAKRSGRLGSDKVLLNKPFQTKQLAAALREALD